MVQREEDKITEAVKSFYQLPEDPKEWQFPGKSARVDRRWENVLFDGPDCSLSDENVEQVCAMLRENSKDGTIETLAFLNCTITSTRAFQRFLQELETLHVEEFSFSENVPVYDRDVWWSLQKYLTESKTLKKITLSIPLLSKNICSLLLCLAEKNRGIEVVNLELWFSVLQQRQSFSYQKDPPILRLCRQLWPLLFRYPREVCFFLLDSNRQTTVFRQTEWTNFDETMISDVEKRIIVADKKKKGVPSNLWRGYCELNSDPWPNAALQGFVELETRSIDLALGYLCTFQPFFVRTLFLLNALCDRDLTVNALCDRDLTVNAPSEESEEEPFFRDFCSSSYFEPYLLPLVFSFLSTSKENSL